jgi:hypothetical protein
VGAICANHCVVSGALPAISKIVLKYDQDGKTHLFIQKWKESLEHSFGKAQHLLDYQHIPRYGSHKVFTIPDPAAEHIRLHKKKTAWQDHKKEIDAKAKSVPKRVSKTPAEKPASRSSKRVARSKAAAKEEEDEEDNEENEASETEQADPDVEFSPPEFTAEDELRLGALQRAYDTKVTGRQKSQDNYERNYPCAYAEIVDTIDEKFLSELKQRAEYKSIQDAQDPLELYNLVLKVCTGLSIAKSSDEVELEAHTEYYSFNQEPNEHISDYYDRFVRAIIDFKRRGVDTGNELKQVGIFKKGLDKRFMPVIEHLQASRMSGLEASAELKTLKGFYDFAANFRAGNARVSDAVTSTHPVYHIKGSSNTATPTKTAKGGKKGGAAQKESKTAHPKSPSRVSFSGATSEPAVEKHKKLCLLCKGEHWIQHCPQLSDKLAILQAAEKPDSESTPKKKRVNVCLVAGEEGVSMMQILYDSGAEGHVFGNRELLTNLVPIDIPFVFEGINGMVVAREKGSFGKVKNVYFAPEAKANVMSCSKAQDDGYRFGHDEDTNTHYFIIEGRKLLFPRVGGFWIHTVKAHRAFVTVAQKESLYSKGELKLAKMAMELSRRLGVPTNANALSLITRNSAGGYDGVSARHFQIANEVYGPRIAALAGKSTEPPNIKVHVDPVFGFKKPVLDVALDIFSILAQAYVIIVAKPIGLISVFAIAKKNAECIAAAVESQLATFKANQYAVRTLLADGERAIAACTTAVEKAGVRVETVIGTHVGQVEVCIRLVKSWMRGIIQELPFKLPQFLGPDLLYFVVQRLNMFSSKRGFNGLSAIEALTGERVNLKLEARAAFGDYAHTATPNLGPQKGDIRVSRTEPGIALYNHKRRGSVNFLSLTTGKRVTRNKFTIMPTPLDVIDKMNKIAAKPLNPDEVITLNEVNCDAELNEFELQEEDIVNNFHHLERDTVIADLHQDVPSTGEYPTVEVAAPVNVIDAPASAVAEMSADTHTEIPLESTSSGTAEGSAEPETVAEPEFEFTETPKHSNQYNTRGIVRDYKHITRVFNITVKKALLQFPDEAKKAIIEELNQLIKKDCFEAVVKSQMSATRRRKLIRSFMFLKIKTKPNGDFDKLKARLVANGSQQDFTALEQLHNSSPTASLTSVLIVAATAAKEKRHVVTVDVKSAYINARMGEDDIVDIIIEPSIASELVQLAAQFSSSLCPDGSLVVQLKGALYGTQQAAKLWYLDISKYLIKLGFVPNEKDCCVFNYDAETGQLTVVLYVDDLKITCICLKNIDWLLLQLEKKYEDITINRGKVHHYLGMTFDYSNGLSITMDKYEEELAAEAKKSVTTPALPKLFEDDVDSPLLEETKRKQFHTLVARMLFIAKRARPDILLPVAYLATKVQRATELHMEKLHRVLSYLRGNRGLHLSVDNDIDGPLVAYTDASHSAHDGALSHTGAIIYVHGLPVSVSSKKQPSVAIGSYEAELMAMSEEAKEVIWCQDFLTSQTGKPLVAKLFCDNKGLVQTLNKDSEHKHSNAKHINTRYFWMREKVAEGTLQVDRLPTEEMVADFFTKPLQGGQFVKLRGRILKEA